MDAFVRRIVCQKMRNDLYSQAQIYRLVDKTKYDYLMQRNALYADSTGMYYNLHESIREN